MRDSTRGQILEACGHIHSDADLLRYLISVVKMKQREFPCDKLNSHRLWVRSSFANLSSKTDYSARTMVRSVNRLKKRGLIFVHPGDDDVNLYELNHENLQKSVQPLPICEQETAQDLELTYDTVSQAPMTPCHRHLCHDVIGPPYMRTNNTIITGDDVLETDQDRESLVLSLKALHVVPEVADRLLAKHTRDLIKQAVAFVKAEMGRKLVNNPAGLLYAFLKEPGKYGFQMTAQGTWTRAQVKLVGSPYKRYTEEKPSNVARGWSPMAQLKEALARIGVDDGNEDADAGQPEALEQRVSPQVVRGCDAEGGEGLGSTSDRQDRPQSHHRTAVRADG